MVEDAPDSPSDNQDQEATGTLEDSTLKPYEITILSKKFRKVAKDITQSLLRSARSGVINMARDFSSAITYHDGAQFVIDEGLPTHSTNVNFTIEYTLSNHDEINPGDCFLTNSPYAGNVHHADYTLHVPVFYEDELIFWTLNRAHQADCGAPSPSTYPAEPESVYQEGPHFPSVRIEENYEEKEDIVRMCKQNIRLGDSIWYGDFKAQVAAVRTGERGIKEICDQYGIDTVKKFANEWLNYGTRMMQNEINQLPDESVTYTANHDPIYINDAAPDGVPVTVTVDIQPDDGKIIVDLTDNMENIPSGFNLCRATYHGAVYGGVLNNIDTTVPKNQGALDQIRVIPGEGNIVGEPEYPAATSVATTNVYCVLFNAVMAAFGELGEPYGIAEAPTGLPPGDSVISGKDFRRNDQEFINQIFIGGGGGPASYGNDGWAGAFGRPGDAGVMFRDSVEIDEQKFPILIEEDELITDSGGPGKWRGAPVALTKFRPRKDPITASFYCNGIEFPSQGILGGKAGSPGRAYKLNTDGDRIDIETINDGIEIRPSETLVGSMSGPGGYGNPLERNRELVLNDVRNEFVSISSAREDYGVVIEDKNGSLTVNEEKTEQLRQELRGD